MNKNRFLVIILSLSIFALVGCGQAKSDSAFTVEAYLNGLVANDPATLSNLSCTDWEQSALMELDSFQGVKASLKDLNCQETGKDGDTSLVVCQGKIVATYNQEDQEIELNVRTYRVVQENSEWRVCGYQ
jgi:hypothetical protein